MKGTRHALDRRRGGIVGDKMPDQLGRDEMRGCRMPREIRQHGFALELSVLAISLTQEGLGAGLV